MVTAGVAFSRNLRTRVGLLIAVAVAVALVISACSSGNDASNSQFQVSTGDGQVSLSLDGHLPPNWPADVPVPSDAKPAGSGSLVGESSGVKVGVYTSRQSPDSVYQYYVSDPSIQMSSKSAVGSGSRFAGHVKMTAPVAATATIVPYQGGALIVVVITGAGS